VGKRSARRAAMNECAAAQQQAAVNASLHAAEARPPRGNAGGGARAVAARLTARSQALGTQRRQCSQRAR